MTCYLIINSYHLLGKSYGCPSGSYAYGVNISLVIGNPFPYHLVAGYNLGTSHFSVNSCSF